MLSRKLRKESGRMEYCLISIKTRQVLEWFGAGRPSKKEIQKVEDRVQYYKNHSKKIGSIRDNIAKRKIRG